MWASARRSARRDDSGIAVISVLGIVVVLTIVVVTLLQIGTSQYQQTAVSTDGMRAQAAAEAGLNAYLARLLQRNDFDQVYMAPGEATRSSDATCDAADVSAPGAGETVAVPANMNDWTHPCGFDAWSALDAEGGLTDYEYAVAVFPRENGSKLQIVAAGRRKDATPTKGALRYVEAKVRPSSFADYQMISQDNIYVNTSTTTSGRVYTTQNAYHRGTVKEWVIANDVVSYPTTTWTGKGILADCSPPEAFFEAGWPSTSCHARERAGKSPEFSNIPKARAAIRSKVLGGGGLFLDRANLGTYRGYEVTLTPAGQITVKRCKEKTGTTPPAEDPDGAGTSFGNRGASPDASAGTTYNYLEDTKACEAGTYTTFPQSQQFYVYSDAPLVVSGYVVGQGIVVSDEDIYLGGNIYYGSDTNETDDDLNNYVLGLHAYSEIILPAYVNGTPELHVRGAALAEEGSYHDSILVAPFTYTGTCESDVDNVPLPMGVAYLCAKDRLFYLGSWYSKKKADVVMFTSAEYAFYEQLKALAPPGWPNATSDFVIERWVERRSNYQLV